MIYLLNVTLEAGLVFFIPRSVSFMQQPVRDNALMLSVQHETKTGICLLELP